MGMKKTLKEIGLAALIGAASLIPSTAQALSGSIRYIASETSNESKKTYGSYPELQMFYTLPAEVKGFTFADFFKKSGYLAKSSLEREIQYGIGPRVQLTHINQPLTQESLGVSAKTKFLPKGVSAKAYFMPFWRDNEFDKVQKKMLLGGSFSLDLPLELKLLAWGEANTQAGKWSYGELELGRRFGDIELSYNPALQPDKNYLPRLEHRACVRVHFGGK